MIDSRKSKVTTVVKNLFMVLVVASSYVILQTFIMFIIDLFTVRYTNRTESFINGNYYLFDMIICLVMLPIYGFWYDSVKHKNQINQIGTAVEPKHKPFDNKGSFANGIVITTIALGFGGISALWLDFATTFLKNAPVFGQSIKSFEETWSDTGDHFYLWVLLSVAIVGPIIEEYIFRGIAYKYLERISTGYLPAIVSGIAFGIWHLEPVQCVYAAIMGIFLGIVYKKTRNLKYTIGIHIINNFTSTLPPFMDTDAVNNVIVFLSIALIIPTIIFIIKMIKRMNLERS